MRYRCDQTDPSCSTGNPNVQVTPGPNGSLIATLTPDQFKSMDPNAAANGIAAGVPICPWADVNGFCGMDPHVAAVDPNVDAIFTHYPQPNTDVVGGQLWAAQFILTRKFAE